MPALEDLAGRRKRLALLAAIMGSFVAGWTPLRSTLP